MDAIELLVYAVIGVIGTLGLAAATRSRIISIKNITPTDLAGTCRPAWW